MGRRTDGRVERFFSNGEWIDGWIDRRRGRARRDGGDARGNLGRTFVSFVGVVRAWERCARDG